MSEKKATNPKDAVGTGKVPITTVSLPVLAELGLVMLEGARKYGRHNYREAGVRSSVYVDAMFRHLARYWEGEDADPDSGMPHLVHIMACAAVLRDSQIQGNDTDDRPPKSPDGWINDMNAHAAKLVEKYPNPVSAVTAVALTPRQWYSLTDIPFEEVRDVVSAKGCHWHFWVPGEKKGDKVVTHEEPGEWLWSKDKSANYDKTGPFTEDIETNDSVLLSNAELKLAEIEKFLGSTPDNYVARRIRTILDSMP